MHDTHLSQKNTIHLCPLQADAAQQHTASRLSVWRDLTMDLIAARELLTEADRSRFKVIAALILLIFGQSDGYFIVGGNRELYCSMPAKSAKKHCLSAQLEDTDLWWLGWGKLHIFPFHLHMNGLPSLYWTVNKEITGATWVDSVTFKRVNSQIDVQWVKTLQTW